MLRRSLAAILLLLPVTSLNAATVPVVKAGDPSQLGLPFSAFSNIALTADGRAAFLGSSTGAFRRTAAGLVHVVAAGDVLADGTQVAGVSAPMVGPNDCVALRAFLVGGGSRILRRCGGTTDVVAVTGEPAPAGGTFAEFVDDVAIGSGGQIAFSAMLDDGTSGLFLDTGGSKTSIARTGSASGFTTLQLIGVSAEGNVGFRAGVVNGRDGFFFFKDGNAKRVVEGGDASPIGGTFRTVTNGSMNDAGTIVFRADLSDGTGGIFFVETGGQPGTYVHPVVREGDVLPGTTVSIKTLQSSLTPSINAAGTIAFRATLTGQEGGAGIFVADAGGTVEQVVKATDVFNGIKLLRLRDPVIADDGSVVVPASIAGNPALFVYRRGAALAALAITGDATDLDTGDQRFRFSAPSARATAETAAFTGSREGIFMASAEGGVEMAAFVGGTTPVGGKYAGFDPPAAEAPGMVVFGAEISGSKDTGRALIVSDARRTRAVARGNENVRGGKLNDFFASALDSLSRPDVGPRREMAFGATLNPGRFPRGLFFERGGKPRALVRANKPAPGGGTFDSFGTPALLRGSRMAFIAQSGTDTSSKRRLFLRSGSHVRVVATQGSGAPGRIGGHFDSFDPPDANDTLVAFRATVDVAGREGLFAASQKTTGVLLATGDAAPDGTKFRSFSSLSLGGRTAVFLGRIQGAPAASGLYRIPVPGVPASDATAPAVEAVGLIGGPTPLGGTIGEFTAIDANRSDGVAVVVDLVGASARSAVLVLDAGTVVP